MRCYLWSRDAIYGTWDAVYGTCDAIYGICDAIYGTCDAIYGTCVAVYGTCDAIYGTCVTISLINVLRSQIIKKEIFISLVEQTSRMGSARNEKQIIFVIMSRNVYNENNCVKIGV
jgi:hypothetical protein